jgi:hypothetical protein
MLEEKLIGFDAREMWLDVDRLWPQDRKNRWLLRHNVIKPLSVDPTTWPSVFDLDVDAEPDQPLEGVLPSKMPWEGVPRKDEYQDEKWVVVFDRAKRLSRPSWIGPRGGWENLSRLETNLRAGWGDLWKPCWIVGITELVDDTDAEAMELHSHYHMSPAQIDEGWQLLGYDVADYFRTSFLTNAGYEDDEVVPLKTRWVSHLNQYHLFDQQETALKYIDVAYERDAGHGPFSAYGLYLIRAVNTTVIA